MVLYDVIYYEKAEKQLAGINKSEARVIFNKVDELKNNSRPQMALKLKGYDCYRLRIGDYRAIYKIDDRNKQVIVIAIKHRSEAYKDL